MPFKKVDPGVRRHMPEIVAMVDRLTTRNKYKIIGEALGINASLVQRYSLAELKRREEENAGNGTVPDRTGGGDLPAAH
jgi:hypothetical protein